ncbi:MAG: enoyl-CoA hydratase/isomerase family protein [Bacteroidetes bacterium]|nr:enoyl-CoA hydratase/isomerase family protein [Bacteroidota bacterium]
MLKYRTISYEQIDQIGHLVLDQPPSNKMTVEFFAELGEAIDLISGDKGLKALVISGKGRHFSAGADLDGLLSIVKEESQQSAEGGHVSVNSFLAHNNKTFLSIGNLEIPVIAAIRGACLGSGMELALFSHFRFCGEDAIFALPESTYNLIPGIGGTAQAVKILGTGKAMELVLRGNTFSAEDALTLKLVDRILPRRHVVDMSIDFARKIPDSYRKEKVMLYIDRIFG